MTQDVILPKIPIEWTLDFHKSSIYQEIMQNDSSNQPSNQEILAQLELLEHCELKKREIERETQKNDDYRGRRDRSRYRNNNGDTQCRKHGDHLWRDCPDNPINRNGNLRNSRQENNQAERQRDHSGERQSPTRERENYVMEEDYNDMEEYEYTTDEEEDAYGFTYEDTCHECHAILQMENTEETITDEWGEEIPRLIPRDIGSDSDESDNEEEMEEDAVWTQDDKEEPPPLMTRTHQENDEASSDDESDDDDNTNKDIKEMNIVNLQRKEKGTKEITGTLRASCSFTLMDEKGKRIKYLGLLDTGSTGSLMSKELVEKHNMKLSRDDGRWTTNTGHFKTTQRATAENIGLPEFLNKRVIPEGIFSINPNPKQKYKAIFGLDFFMCERNRFYT